MHSSALISVRVKPEVAERLKALSQIMHRSSSFLAAEALEEYLDIHEWQIQAIQAGLNAVDREEVVDFESVKKKWEKRREDSSR
jgi:RHH-type transcriptional regulator, rel operon repressor / antitoxin RelB